MKNEEDEAFDELAKRQGAWGGGFTAKRKMAADKLWDKPSVAFDEWWNGDNDESTNPFRLESGAYWAWAGWKAALAQPEQRPWVGLTPEEAFKSGCERENVVDDCYGYASRLATSLWEKHYKIESPNWKPSDTLINVLTQIDNMTAGLYREKNT